PEPVHLAGAHPARRPRPSRPAGERQAARGGRAAGGAGVARGRQPQLLAARSRAVGRGRARVPRPRGGDAMSPHIAGVAGLPEVEPGADLGGMIAEAAERGGTPLADGDVLVVTSKVVSKSEGRTVDLEHIEPSPFAKRYAAQWEKDPAVIELVLRE